MQSGSFSGGPISSMVDLHGGARVGGKKIIDRQAKKESSFEIYGSPKKTRGKERLGLAGGSLTKESVVHKRGNGKLELSTKRNRFLLGNRMKCGCH